MTRIILHRNGVQQSMGKAAGRTKNSDGILFVAGILAALLVVWTVWCFIDATNNDPVPLSFPELRHFEVASGYVPDLRHESPEVNFYDDPKLNYTIEAPTVKNWDEKRAEWLRQHPSFASGAENRVLMVTGSQATPCKNPIGDYLLLKLFRNKVDYCRRHGIDIFYNNVLLQPKMFSFWAKTPTLKAAMLAHPEAEWIWWVDSDAVITDMDFMLPLERYEAHNLVVHGWSTLVFEKKSWTSINAGVFLIRNCQWAMDFMDTWARMGPQSPEYERWGEIQSEIFRDKAFPEADDQAGLIYLLLKQNKKWGHKFYIESQYYFEGYWMEIIGELDKIGDGYLKIEKMVPELRRRHAEMVSERYARVWEEHLKDAGYGRGSRRRPFITHFTGCQPCSGEHNPMYPEKTCVDGMQKALIFADNQVLRNYGYVHPDPMDPSTVVPVPFDYPHPA